MKTSADKIQRDHWPALMASVYAVTALALVPQYQYNLYPDTISYISIARKYAAGDFANAVNGYWGPLLSWTMVPFLDFGFDPLQSLKLVSIIAGVLTILAANRLFVSQGVAPSIRRLLLLAVVPVALYFSLSLPTPDFLLTAWLSAYFAVGGRADYPERRSSGWVCGLLGGLAYLTKHYALPFFIMHFAIVNAWHYKRTGARDAVLRHACAGLVACTLIVMPWVWIISTKYGYVTVGTAATRNHAYVGPQSRGDTLGPKGLVTPPNASAISAWEDPSYDLLDPWSPIESRAGLLHQINIVGRNLVDVGAVLWQFSPLSIVLIPVYLFQSRLPGRWLGHPTPTHTFLAFTLILYPAGYLLLLIEERYLWPLAVVLMAMAGVLATAIARRSRLSVVTQRLGVAVCLGSFIAPASVRLAQDFRAGKNVHELGTLLKEQFGIHGNLAAHNQFKTPLYLSYYIGGRFYGTSDRKLPEGTIEALLLQSSIDYYFVWVDAEASDPAVPRFLAKYREVTGGRLSGLRIYSLKERHAIARHSLTISSASHSHFMEHAVVARLAPAITTLIACTAHAMLRSLGFRAQRRVARTDARVTAWKR